MGMGFQKNQLVVIRAARGSFKRKPGDKLLAEAWAEYKRERIHFSIHLHEESMTKMGIIGKVVRAGIDQMTREAPTTGNFAV